MYDRTIRRRRAVLILLVGASLILITASFGSGGSGPLGSLQRALGTVVSPIQEGASQALSPVRDLFGWAGDTIDAKGELEKARKDRDRWQAQAIAAQADARRGRELQALADLKNTPTNIDSYAPVAARVIGRSASPWNSRLIISEGSSHGLKAEMPVVASDTGNGAGLVGKITEVTSSSAVVTLLTGADMSVGAKTIDGRSTGDLVPSGGDPNDLVLDAARLAQSTQVGDIIVTAGTVSSREDLKSLYPSDIPIGRISKIDDPGSETELAHVRPFVTLGEIEFVQVLTRPVQP